MWFVCEYSTIWVDAVAGEVVGIGMKQNAQQARTLAMSFYRQGMTATYAALMKAADKMEEVK
ncbi:MAG: hypothetical protein GY820_41875 [Gammaproteobacteria bacterium]|nr:hypothetical protein [Gammaproteobacteria bacterium]